VDPLSVLPEPSTELERSAEDMLVDLERLVDAVEMKLESAPDAARRRFEGVLLPKLDDARRLVAQASPLAKNAVEDVIALFREMATTAPVTR
jgi:hypothetical protein